MIQLCHKISHYNLGRTFGLNTEYISTETVFMNTKNSKTNEPHKFVLNLSQRLDLRSSNKHVALQNLSIYYTWKNIRKRYKNSKLKIIAPTWTDEFQFLRTNIDLK